jgi:hypothetical protein
MSTVDEQWKIEMKWLISTTWLDGEPKRSRNDIPRGTIFQPR